MRPRTAITFHVSSMASVGQLKEQIATNRNYERLQSRIKQRSKYKFYFSTPIAQLFGYFWPAQVVHTALLQQFLMLIIDINKQKYPSIHRSGCVRRRKRPCESCRRRSSAPGEMATCHLRHNQNTVTVPVPIFTTHFHCKQCSCSP